MKRISIISIILMMTLMFLVTTPAFATDSNQAMLNNSDESPVEIIEIIESDDVLAEGSLSKPVMKGNQRYRYTTKTVYSNKSVKTIYVSEKEAKSQSRYEAVIKAAMSAIVGSFCPATKVGKVLSFISGLAVGEFYTSGMTDYGTYTFTAETAKVIKTNVLTKKSYIAKTGYRVKITHRGKSTTSTYWFK